MGEELSVYQGMGDQRGGGERGGSGGSGRKGGGGEGMGGSGGKEREGRRKGGGGGVSPSLTLSAKSRSISVWFNLVGIGGTRRRS